MVGGNDRPTPLSEVSDAPPDRRRWAALAVLCTATFIVILDGSIVFVAVPPMTVELGLSASAVQWMLSSYLLAFGGLLLLGGRMADLLGRRRIFMAGGVLLAVASLLCGLAPNAEILIGARVLEGFAAAIMTPTALSILTTTFREGRERNRALGFWPSAGGIGGTTGALLGGPLNEWFGWGAIFLVNIPFALAMVVLSPMVLKESYGRDRTRTFDVAGALTSSIAMVLLVYAIVDAPHAGWWTTQTIGLFAAVVVLLALFVRIEKRSAAPLVPLKYFRSRAFVGGNLVVLAVGMAVHGAMSFVTTQYAQAVLGYSAMQFGLMFSVMTLLSIVGSMLAGGVLIARFGQRAVAIGALTLIGLGCLAMVPISPQGSFVGDMLLGMAIFGPGLGAGSVVGQSAALSGVSERDAGVASGMTTAAFMVGGSLGIAVLTTVTVAQTAGPTPAAITDGFSAAYAVGITFAVAGIIAAVTLLRGRHATVPTAVAGGAGTVQPIDTDDAGGPVDPGRRAA